MTPSIANLQYGCDVTSTLPFRPDISFATDTGHIICYRHADGVVLVKDAKPPYKLAHRTEVKNAERFAEIYKVASRL
jgi:hypothetical protein